MAYKLLKDGPPVLTSLTEEDILQLVSNGLMEKKIDDDEFGCCAKRLSAGYIGHGGDLPSRCWMEGDELNRTWRSHDFDFVEDDGGSEARLSSLMMVLGGAVMEYGALSLRKLMLTWQEQQPLSGAQAVMLSGSAIRGKPLSAVIYWAWAEILLLFCVINNPSSTFRVFFWQAEKSRAILHSLEKISWMLRL
ncbi:hypothetical protein V8G54_028758 [Vigna mungo]|uniref:Uncharacterized protein n=1 Tax=Vigna mungo TaxID=3915 RepID=A0AAQ3MSU4_VIGMU